MPPPSGSCFRVGVWRGNLGSDATGWWTMARRAAGALTAVFTLAAVLLPAALSLVAAAPAEAASAAGSQLPATVAFTGLSPLFASPGKTLTVSGVVKNTGPADEQLSIQLFDSPTPIGSVAELQQAAAAGTSNGQLMQLATKQLPALRPGQTASWSVAVPVGAMQLTTFGAYPLAAQVSNSQAPLNRTLTFVPYVPAKKGQFGSSVPPTQKVSLVWPLMDQPLLDGPWQDACTGQQAAALAGSLASGGRLSELVDAANATASTAVVQAQSDSGRAAREQTPVTESQSLASADGLTWAVDPALLANVAALSRCGSREPRWAQTASAWLTRFKTVSSKQPLFVTPYGDPDVSTLIGAGFGSDVENAFTYGSAKAAQVLGAQAITSGLAWVPDGPTSYTTVENLAGRDHVSTLLLSGSALPSERASVVRRSNGTGGFIGGGYTYVLLANDSLTTLLGSLDSAGSGFATAQQFLAETALLARQNPSVPMIVAPPRRWQPAPGLAADLLTAVASAPWLSPATLGSLTTARHIPTVSPADTAVPAFGPYEISQLRALDGEVGLLDSISAGADPSPHLAVSTAESSAYTGRHRLTALDMIKTLQGQIANQATRVHIVAEPRITLGGTRGSVPVSIANGLGYPVRVKLQVVYPLKDGTRVTPSPAGLVTIQSYSARTVKLRIAATQVGSTTVTMYLVNSVGQALPTKHGARVRTTVQTTQVGLLGVIILGAALGVFLVASGVRGLRRGKPRAGHGESDESGQSDDYPSGQGTEQAAPDTVVAEQGELGTAGTPRPR